MYSLLLAASLSVMADVPPAGAAHDPTQILPALIVRATPPPLAASLPTSVVDQAEVMALPPDLREELETRVIRQASNDTQRMRLLAKWMFAPDGLQIQYRHDATYTVAEAWQHREANCLTFTLLTVALARATGLESYGQHLDDTLAWRQAEDTLYRTTHVNAGILVHSQRFTIDVASDEVMTRSPPERINDTRLLAQFYNNRAAELSDAGALQLALAHARMALQLDPEFAVTWNNLGVLEMRAGNAAKAERSYLQSLVLDSRQASALTNLVAYYERIGEPGKARPLQRRLDAVHRASPFHQFLLALDAERRGELRNAARFYRRAIHLYPGEHRFHFGLARVYYLQHKPNSAGEALERARSLSQGREAVLYEAKLAKLRQH